MATTAIRLVLTALLLCGVYTETGLWTTVFGALMAIRIETEPLIWKWKGN